MNLSEEVLQIYVEGSHMMNTSFLSTSKKEQVAKIFLANEQNEQCIAGLFTYKIENINNQRTAIDISSTSYFPEEEEIVILPFSAFRVVSVTPPTDPSMPYEIFMEEVEPTFL